MENEIPEEGILLTDTGPADSKRGEYRPFTGLLASYLSDPDVWANYEDKELAEAEEALRDWIEEMCKIPSWRATNSKRRKYTFSMLFELVTGDKYDQKKHASQVRMWVTLFRYYSSRIQKAGNINGKMYTKTVYLISPSRLKKPPYSLRLRVPWLVEHDMAIDARTIYGPMKDSLKPGHARNPRTEENMRKRREMGRKRYEQWSLGKKKTL